MGIRTCLRMPRGSDPRLLVAGLTSAVLAFAVAGVGHDLTQNYADLAAAALITGVLVSVCTAASASSKEKSQSSLSPGLTPTEG